jgi:hypothetical protein
VPLQAIPRLILLADVVDGEDVGMVQRGGCLGFQLKTA